MQVSTKNLSNSRIEIKFEIQKQEMEPFYQKAVLALGKELEIPGFRKGKAPTESIESILGKERIMAEAMEEAINEEYRKAVKNLAESGIEAIGQPEISISKAPKIDGSGPLEFKALTSVMPQVKLPDYKKIASKVKRGKAEAGPDEIENALKWLQKSRAKFSLKNGLAAKGDWVEIEYSKLPENRSIKDSFILGEGKFPLGFEDSLEGMKAGEEKSFKLEEGEFKARMVSVQTMELPELNDEFAKNLGQFENLAALKQSVESGLRQEKEAQEIQRMRQEMIKNISEKSEMEIPEILLEEQKKRYLENLKSEVLDKLQMTFEEYLKKVGKTEKDLMDSFKEAAENQVKISLTMREIQKKEDIQVSSQEVKEEVEKILSRYPNPEEVRKQFGPEYLESYTKELIKQEKTFRMLEEGLLSGEKEKI
jgi:trigger factor